MSPTGPFATPTWWMQGAQIARVTSVEDPDSLARVQVQILSPDADGEALLWARVAVPFAGNNRGAFFIPDVDDEVLVVFPGASSRSPIVIGGLWNGFDVPPETLPGKSVDRWTITGKNGTRIAIVEESTGQEKVEIETPNGVKATLTDQAGGKIQLQAAGSTVTMDTQGVTVQSSMVKVSATMVDVTSGFVKVAAGLSQFQGIVLCDALITNSVISSSYTPGAGNIW